MSRSPLNTIRLHVFVLDMWYAGLTEDCDRN